MSIYSSQQLLQRYSQAFLEDHRLAADEFYADHIVLRVPGRHRWAGVFQGRQAARNALDAMSRATNGSLRAREFHGVAFADAHAFVNLRMEATRPGREFQWERVLIYRFADDRIAEITNFEFDLHGVDEFFEND